MNRPQSRHNKIADDSAHLRVVISKVMLSELRSMVDKSRPTVSAVVRGFIHKGICDEQRAKCKSCVDNIKN
jgi:hypothetical protein